MIDSEDVIAESEAETESEGEAELETRAVRVQVPELVESNPTDHSPSRPDVIFSSPSPIVTRQKISSGAFTKVRHSSFITPADLSHQSLPYPSTIIHLPSSLDQGPSSRSI
jgi:hypothetical protein